GHVTGVQTCALPICIRPSPLAFPGHPTRGKGLPSRRSNSCTTIPFAHSYANWPTFLQGSCRGTCPAAISCRSRANRQCGLQPFRSEERRVGKECRFL